MEEAWTAAPVVSITVGTKVTAGDEEGGSVESELEKIEVESEAAAPSEIGNEAISSSMMIC